MMWLLGYWGFSVVGAQSATTTKYLSVFLIVFDSVKSGNFLEAIPEQEILAYNKALHLLYVSRKADINRCVIAYTKMVSIITFFIAKLLPLLTLLTACSRSSPQQLLFYVVLKNIVRVRLSTSLIHSINRYAVYS